MDDTIAVREYIEKNSVKNAVVAGGGFIGIELAEAMTEKGLTTTIIKNSDKILPAMFDEEMSLLIGNVLIKKGVVVITNDSVVKVTGDSSSRLAKIETKKGEEIPVGVLLVAKGFVPNVSLAKEAGLKIGESGAIWVSENMQTSDPDIYAGGDCVESAHLVSGRKMNLALGSLANIQGRVIADCIAGDDETEEQG